MKRGVLFVGCAAVVGCLMCVGLAAGIFFLVFRLTAPVADASNAFLDDVKNGNYAAAYDKCSVSLQAEFGSAEGIQRFFAQFGKPAKWSFNSRSITNDRGEVSGSVTFEDGTKRKISLVLFKENDKWKIAGVHFN